jgi:hypothetical protein
MKIRLQFLFCVFLFLSNGTFSQENNPSEKQLHIYLISKYGVEAAEIKLLLVKNYEEISGKCVVTDAAYDQLMKKWESRLQIESDGQLKDQILKRMSLFLPYSQIESTIHE